MFKKLTGKKHKNVLTTRVIRKHPALVAAAGIGAIGVVGGAVILKNQHNSIIRGLEEQVTAERETIRGLEEQVTAERKKQITLVATDAANEVHRKQILREMGIPQGGPSEIFPGQNQDSHELREYKRRESSLYKRVVVPSIGTLSERQLHILDFDLRDAMPQGDESFDRIVHRFALESFNKLNLQCNALYPPLGEDCLLDITTPTQLTAMIEKNVVAKWRYEQLSSTASPYSKLKEKYPSEFEDLEKDLAGQDKHVNPSKLSRRAKRKLRAAKGKTPTAIEALKASSQLYQRIHRHLSVEQYNTLDQNFREVEQEEKFDLVLRTYLDSLWRCQSSHPLNTPGCTGSLNYGMNEHTNTNTVVKWRYKNLKKQLTRTGKYAKLKNSSSPEFFERLENAISNLQGTPSRQQLNDLLSTQYEQYEQYKSKNKANADKSATAVSIPMEMPVDPELVSWVFPPNFVRSV